MLSSVISILYNDKNKTYHPIVFTERPFPGGKELDKENRYKSKMHHTEGFSNREDAIDCARGRLVEKMKERSFEVYFDLKNDILWDGKGTPAMVHFYNPSNLKEADI